MMGFKTKLTLGAIASLSMISSSCAEKATGTGNPVEVGSVEWGRNLDKVKAASVESKKPIMVLFQEVPG